MFLLDSQGFVRPVVFLIIALGILFYTYKKRTKWVWLTLVPIVSLPFYLDYVDTTVVHQQQEGYVRDYWQVQYQPDSLYTALQDADDTYTWWEVETEGGGYLLRFYTDQSDGFEVVDTLWEDEPLRGRRNTLEVMDMLGLTGWLEFSGDHYTVRGDDVWQVDLTGDSRVESVLDSEERLLYELEDEEGGDKK